MYEFIPIEYVLLVINFWERSLLFIVSSMIEVRLQLLTRLLSCYLLAMITAKD